MAEVQRVVETTTSNVTTNGLRDPQSMVWSFSRISTVERCFRMFWYKYIESRPTPSTVPLKVGKIFHQSTNWVLAHGYSIEDAIRFALYEYDGLPESESFASLYRMLENAMYYVPFNDNLSIEVPIEIVTRLGKLIGVIDVLEDDFLNDSVVISDFKSSWVESEAEKSMQLKVYGWMFKELRGSAFTGEMKGQLIFPRINKISEFIFTETHFEEAKTWFIEMVSTIRSKPLEKDEWPRTHKKEHCEQCPFAGLCASDFNDKFPNSGDYANVKEAQAAGEFYLQQNAYLKQLKKHLKAYVKKGNDVKVGEGEWFIELSTPTPKVIDVKAWSNFIDDMGLDSADYLEANKDKIEEILVHDEDGIAEQLVEWTKPRENFKFGVKPITEPSEVEPNNNAKESDLT